MLTKKARECCSLAVGLFVAASYVAIAVAFSWPLGRDLSGQLPGSPSGDTGVYVWNLWVFRDALLRGEWPFSTSSILALSPSVNLSLENYTVFQNLLAVPLLSVVNATVAFNLIYLGMSALTAFATFRLALVFTPHLGIAWLAGLAFAWSPVMVARSTAHMSLVAAAALPFVVLSLYRAFARPTTLRWMTVGACAAWAAYCDVYFAVFSAVLGALLVADQLVTWRTKPRELGAAARRMRHTILVIAGGLSAVSAWIVLSGGRTLWLGATPLHLYTVYTPILATCIFLALWWVLGRSIRLERTTVEWRPFVAGVGWATVTAGTLLLPWLVGVLSHLVAEGEVNPLVRWRSSPSGVDLLAFFTPNPNSPLLGATSEWVATRPGGFAENVASLPWTLLLTIGCAWHLWRHDLHARRWLWKSIFFATLALGPFVHILGFNSGVVTPWTFLRFAPIVGMARSPARFSVLVTMAVTLLFVIALTKAWTRLGRHRGNALVAFCGLALVLELAPIPRTVYRAHPPSVYEVVASDPRDVRILELPFGVRDGTSSLGNYSAASQYYQTRHRKRLTGGYLSRLPRATRDIYMQGTFFRTLIELSEGVASQDVPRETLLQRGRARMRDLQIGYVVADTAKTSTALLELVCDAFALELVAQDGDLELYTTAIGRGEDVPASLATDALPAAPPVQTP